MKKILLYPFRFMDGLVDRIVSLAGAIGLAQFPQFFAQYLQRLGGHLKKRLTIARYQAAAETLDHPGRIPCGTFASGNEVLSPPGRLSPEVERLIRLEEAFCPWKKPGLYPPMAFPAESRSAYCQGNLALFPSRPAHDGRRIAYGLTGLLLAWGLYQD